jgi:hypothetical protein
MAYNVTAGSPPDARARRWSVRNIVAATNLQNFDFTLDQSARRAYAAKPSNLEMKLLVRPRMEAMLYPAVITDRDVVTIFEDAGSLRWGIWFQGRQYVALFERWFDDLWASIPESYLFYSRGGFNDSVIAPIRKELEVIESAQAHQTA